MRGTVAKRLRRENREAGLPDNGRTTGPNITDLDDTREDRRLKTFRKKEYARQMRESHPQVLARKAAFWQIVTAWLLLPEYREGIGNPTRGRHPLYGSTFKPEVD